MNIRKHAWLDGAGAVGRWTCFVGIVLAFGVVYLRGCAGDEGEARRLVARAWAQGSSVEEVLERWNTRAPDEAT